MEVLKHTSPQDVARAPNPWPWNVEPSSRAKIAFIQKSLEIKSAMNRVKGEGCAGMCRGRPLPRAVRPSAVEKIRTLHDWGRRTGFAQGALHKQRIVFVVFLETSPGVERLG
jgi:hypothetical protein